MYWRGLGVCMGSAPGTSNPGTTSAMPGKHGHLVLRQWRWGWSGIRFGVRVRSAKNGEINIGGVLGGENGRISPWRILAVSILRRYFSQMNFELKLR